MVCSLVACRLVDLVLEKQISGPIFPSIQKMLYMVRAEQWILIDSVGHTRAFRIYHISAIRRMIGYTKSDTPPTQWWQGFAHKHSVSLHWLPSRIFWFESEVHVPWVQVWVFHPQLILPCWEVMGAGIFWILGKIGPLLKLSFYVIRITEAKALLEIEVCVALLWALEMTDKCQGNIESKQEGTSHNKQ